MSMNDYSIKNVVGEGSFGVVMLCFRKSDRKRCVIKRIKLDNMGKKEARMTEQESKLLSKMNHPNIIEFWDSFLEKETKSYNYGAAKRSLYIVMEFADGGDLESYLKKQKSRYINESTILHMFAQISLAIKHIHDRKILHRDLKSQNIFLTNDGTIKLGDFGIARVLKNTGELASTRIGTPYYMSPEIMQDKKYNSKTDIWSLGCVLYEMCALKVPFEGNTMRNLIMNIMHNNPRPLPSSFSSPLKNLVDKMLSKKSSSRPSINTILSTSVVKQMISKCLDENEYNDEFSHTTIHGLHILDSDKQQSFQIQHQQQQQQQQQQHQHVIEQQRAKQLLLARQQQQQKRPRPYALGQHRRLPVSQAQALQAQARAQSVQNQKDKEALANLLAVRKKEKIKKMEQEAEAVAIAEARRIAKEKERLQIAAMKAKEAQLQQRQLQHQAAKRRQERLEAENERKRVNEERLKRANAIRQREQEKRELRDKQMKEAEIARRKAAIKLKEEKEKATLLQQKEQQQQQQKQQQQIQRVRASVHENHDKGVVSVDISDTTTAVTSSGKPLSVFRLNQHAIPVHTPARLSAYEMVTENAVISGKNASPPTQTWFSNIEQQVHSIQRKVRHLQGKESPEQPQPLVPSEARHGVDEHSSEREKEHSSNILKPERSSIVRKQPSAQSVAAAAGAKVKQEIEKNNQGNKMKIKKNMKGGIAPTRIQVSRHNAQHHQEIKQHQQQLQAKQKLHAVLRKERDREEKLREVEREKKENASRLELRRKMREERQKGLRELMRAKREEVVPLQNSGQVVEALIEEADALPLPSPPPINLKVSTPTTSVVTTPTVGAPYIIATPTNPSPAPVWEVIFKDKVVDNAMNYEDGRNNNFKRQPQQQKHHHHQQQQQQQQQGERKLGKGKLGKGKFGKGKEKERRIRESEREKRIVLTAEEMKIKREKEREDLKSLIAERKKEKEDREANGEEDNSLQVELMVPAIPGHSHNHENNDANSYDDDQPLVAVANGGYLYDPSEEPVSPGKKRYGTGIWAEDINMHSDHIAHVTNVEDTKDIVYQAMSNEDDAMMQLKPPVPPESPTTTTHTTSNPIPTQSNDNNNGVDHSPAANDPELASMLEEIVDMRLPSSDISNPNPYRNSDNIEGTQHDHKVEPVDDASRNDDDSLDGAHHLHTFEDGETTIVGDGLLSGLTTNNKSNTPSTTKIDSNMSADRDVNSKTLIDDSHLLGHINNSQEQIQQIQQMQQIQHAPYQLLEKERSNKSITMAVHTDDGEEDFFTNEEEKLLQELQLTDNNIDTIYDDNSNNIASAMNDAVIGGARSNGVDIGLEDDDTGLEDDDYYTEEAIIPEFNGENFEASLRYSALASDEVRQQMLDILNLGNDGYDDLDMTTNTSINTTTNDIIDDNIALIVSNHNIEVVASEPLKNVDDFSNNKKNDPLAATFNAKDLAIGLRTLSDVDDLNAFDDTKNVDLADSHTSSVAVKGGNGNDAVALTVTSGVVVTKDSIGIFEEGDDDDDDDDDDASAFEEESVASMLSGDEEDTALVFDDDDDDDDDSYLNYHYHNEQEQLDPNLNSHSDETTEENQGYLVANTDKNDMNHIIDVSDFENNDMNIYADIDPDVARALKLREYLMQQLGMEAFVAAYGCVRNISLQDGANSHHNNKSKNSTKSSSGSSMGNSDEALLNEFADIVGLDGMKYLASFFTLVTEEERLSQDYLE